MGVRVLFVSPRSEDAIPLGQMLQEIAAVDYAKNLAQARKRLGTLPYPVVLTESTLTDGQWTDLLAVVRQLAPQARVIVTNRLADTKLWTEVLEQGCFDLITQPFHAAEVQRIVSTAAQSRTMAA